MANSLIPYSFIPGTKAKADEVNANFIALANQITENKEYTDSKIDETISTVNNDRAGIKLENTTLISNCVLESPNGIVTYTGNTITVKKGLRLILPDGLNEDGTVKNIEHTVPEDVLLTSTKNGNMNCVYVTEDSCAIATFYQHSNITPIKSEGIWYKTTENQHYKYNKTTTSWEPITCSIVAAFENLDGTISNVKPFYPITLLKTNDLNLISDYMIPDYSKEVGISLMTTYTAKVNGYVYARLESQQSLSRYIQIDSRFYLVAYFNIGHIGKGSLCLPIAKGSTYLLKSDVGQGLFIPMKGEV